MRPTEQLQLVANVSMLFDDVPYLQRFSAAAAAGFQGVESWWPFGSAVPEPHERDRFLRAIEESGIPLVGLNLFAGDMPAGERGLVCRLDRRADLEANVDAVVDIARETGCRVVNALYGQHQPGADERDERSLAIEQLGRAAQLLDEVGVTVVVEPLTAGTAGAYPLLTAADVMAVVHAVRERFGLSNIGMLFDTFHLANNGDDLLDVIDSWSRDIAHVQLADAPGRGAPGSGTLPIGAALDRLWDAGYRGAVAGEYRPAGEGVDWVSRLPHVGLAATDL